MEGHLEAMIAARDEVSALLEAKQAQRAALDAQRAVLDAEVADLVNEVEVFSRYLARHGLPVVVAPPSEVGRWRAMTRTDAIMAALHAANEACSPREISDHLRRMGRADDPAEVSRALNRLKEQRRAESQVRGLWAPSDTPGQDTEVSTESGSGGAEHDLPTDEQLFTKGRQPEATPCHPDVSADEPPTARDAIFGVLRAEGRTMSMSEIVARAPEFGATAQPETIRSLLTKLAKSGDLERPSHGQYRLVTPDSGDPEGESDVESTTGSPPDHEVSGTESGQMILKWSEPPGVRTPSVA